MAVLVRMPPSICLSVFWLFVGVGVGEYCSDVAADCKVGAGAPLTWEADANGAERGD